MVLAEGTLKNIHSQYLPDVIYLPQQNWGTMGALPTAWVFKRITMVNGKREKKTPQLFHKYATKNAQFQDLKTYCKSAQS